MKTNCLHILVNKIIYILSFKELYESFLFFFIRLSITFVTGYWNDAILRILK